MALDNKKKKKNRKRKLKWIPFLLLAIIISYFYLGINHISRWMNFDDIRKSLNLFDYMLWFFLTFYISLTVHELGHFFAFVFQRIKLRALYITIFVFHKTLKGWRFAIKPKLIVLLGGLVVPDFGVVKSDDELLIIKNKFSKALIAAPIVTITLLVLIVLIFILSVIFIPNSGWMGIIFMLSLFALPINLIFIYSFTLSNPMFYGDFVAYKKMKTDSLFALAMIIQYSMFTLSDSEESSHYLWEKSRDILREKEISKSQFHTMILISYIDGIIRQGEQLDSTIDIKINRIPIRKYLNDDQGINLCYDIACYHYFNGNVERAYQLFNDIQKMISSKLDEKMVTYYKNKYKHIMHIEYQDQFLSNQENYYIGNHWIFDILINPYEMLEAYHEKLPFREYSSLVIYEEIIEPVEEEQKSDLE
ncbi:MAG: M50 family metallopeptidase [Acholeplasmataceae bacterium]|nr:M50 family metallopeptidase [Acholeplasmataceae bacterium]